MNIIEVKTYDFKTNLSSYIAQLNNGEADKIIVKNRDKVVGEFLPPTVQKKKRNLSLGIWEGLRTREEIDAAFDPEFEAEIAADFYGEE